MHTVMVMEKSQTMIAKIDIIPNAGDPEWTLTLISV
jgi:hypothetical protein